MILFISLFSVPILLTHWWSNYEQRHYLKEIKYIRRQIGLFTILAGIFTGLYISL